MATYFTSDTHFGHRAIIEYSKRPYADVPAMNEGLIANWNAVVKPEDKVYHLGDFAMGPKNLHKSYLERLNGYKILVRGNHDQKADKMLWMGFNEVHPHKFEIINGLNVYMAHIPISNDPYQNREGGRAYPVEFTPEPPPHDIWLCGHVHNAYKRVGNVINVGVDVWDYRPVTFEQLVAAEQSVIQHVTLGGD